MDKEEETRFCNTCGGRLLSADGELVCSSCGAVSRVVVEHSYPSSKVRTRTGDEVDHLGSFLGPSEGVSERSYSGLRFLGSTPSYMKLISDHGLIDPRLKTFEYASQIVERAAEHLSLPPHVTLDAKRILRKMLNYSQLKRGMIPTIAATSIILACRLDGNHPVSWRRLKSVMSNLGHTVRFRHVVSIETSSPERPRLDLNSCVRYQVKRTLAEPNLQRKLAIGKIPSIVYGYRLERTTLEVLDKIGRGRVGGYSPFAVSATAIYLAESMLAEREQRTRLFNLRELSNILGMSQSTLREQMNKFRRLVLA